MNINVLKMIYGKKAHYVKFLPKSARYITLGLNWKQYRGKRYKYIVFDDCIIAC